MKRFSEQLHKKSETVKLRAAEKRELRERLVTYMEYHPLPAELKTKSIEKTKASDAQVFSEPFTTVTIPFSNIFKTVASVTVLFLVVMPFMAERAVPGDTLYAVKVQFNEELRSSLTFDTYQKVEWETERLNRRIAEARLLASEGRLTEEVEAEVAEAVRTHTENAKREIETLRSTDADGAAIASIALDTTLEVQSTSLKEEDQALLAASTSTDQLPNLIADVIDESRVETAAQNASSTPPAFDKLMARVEQNTTRIYELFGTIEISAPETKLTDAKRRIADIERAIVDAIVLKEEDDTAARLALVDVLQRTQRLIVYLTELKVNGAVDIEKLLPIVLTEEEEAVIRAELTNSLDEKRASLNSLLENAEEDSVIGKVVLAIEAIDELSAKMATSSDNFTAFQLAANEAHAIADDMIRVLEQLLDPVVEEVLLPVDTASTSASTTEPTVDQATSTTPTEEEPILDDTASSTESTDHNTSTSTEQVDNE